MAIDIETTGIHWTESQPAITCQRVETAVSRDKLNVCVEWPGCGGRVDSYSNQLYLLESIRNAIK